MVSSHAQKKLARSLMADFPSMRFNEAMRLAESSGKLLAGPSKSTDFHAVTAYHRRLDLIQDESATDFVRAPMDPALKERVSEIFRLVRSVQAENIERWPSFFGLSADTDQIPE